MAARRPNHAAELEHACRWATGWLHGARRLTAPATRPEGVLLLDSGPALDLESVHTQALELALRRAGLRVLVLSAALAEDRFSRAIRALRPSVVVLCGSGAGLGVTAPPLRRALAGTNGAKLLGYRAARLVSGRNGVPELGALPREATATLIAVLERE
jgi:MerR family transcriptional regulator, light-induced transcriptional regulator